jgi:hypothetical protein
MEWENTLDEQDLRVTSCKEWGVLSSNSVYIGVRRFGGTYPLHLRDRRVSQAKKQQKQLVSLD